MIQSFEMQVDHAYVTVMTPARERRFIELGDQLSRDKWAAGDLTKKTIEEIEAELTLTAGEGTQRERVRMKIYRRIAMLMGVSGESVRKWMAAAVFYPQEVRSQYMPPLTFSHFAKAMQMGPRWQEFLDLAMDLMENELGGNRPNVDFVEDRFYNRNPTAQLDRALDDLEQGTALLPMEAPGDDFPQEDNEEPDTPPGVALYLMEQSDRLVAALFKAAERLPVRKELRTELEATLSRLGTLLLNIREELENRSKPPQ